MLSPVALAAVVRAVEDLPGVEKAKDSASANTLTIKGPATEEPSLELACY